MHPLFIPNKRQSNRLFTKRHPRYMVLQPSEGLNQAILSALPDLIIRMQADGTYLDVKAGNFPLLKPADEMIGDNVRNILSPEAASQRLAAAALALETGTMQQYEFKLEVDGQVYWREARIVPLEKQEVLVSIRDFTDLRKTEAALFTALQEEQMARQAAEQASRVKDEFLAVLSHELRSPLNPILGWASLLRQGNLNLEKAKIAAQTIERNARLQAQLIDDLLDIARMLRGKLNLKMTSVNLKTSINQALETVQQIIKAKSLQIETQLADNLMVQGDPTRLQQIFWNLLSNAVKFTPERGHITVKLTASENQAQVQVTDTGVGIPSEFLPHVFDRFCQEDSTQSRQFGGLGLGLAIVRQLTELHGGTVWASSAGENQGATFTVTLPLQDQENTAKSEASNPRSGCDLAGLKIFVVDDNPDSRLLLSSILEQSQATITEFASGLDCLECLDQSLPDLLICDIGMPEIDGYQLLQHIQQRFDGPDQRIIAIALTAYAGQDHEQRSLAAGFQAHLAKPIDVDHLMATIQSLLGA